MQRRKRQRHEHVPLAHDERGDTEHGHEHRQGHGRRGRHDRRAGAVGRRLCAPLVVGLALTLAGVLMAPAAPAGAYVNPYGRYQVEAVFRDQCLTVPFSGVPGTWVIRANCTGNANQAWHFDRVGTYGGDPVFVIRATHRGTNSSGEWVDCLDLPYAEVTTGRPLWNQPCRPNNRAQQWRQVAIGTWDDEPIYAYASMVAPDSGWYMRFNTPDAYPHLVMVYGVTNAYQFMAQHYIGP